MTLRTKAAAVAVSLAAVLGAAHAQASIVNWTLSDGLFDDKGTFAGSFTFDSATDTITNWNVTTTAGAAFNGTSYAPGCSSLGSCNFASDNGSGPNFLTSTFDTNDLLSLTNIPMGVAGTVILLTGSEVGTSTATLPFTRTVVGGHAAGVLAGVPEPAEWALMIVGAGLAGATLRARRKAALA
jgi:hypothetical protein